MQFNSIEFLIFFVLSTAVYYWLPHRFRIYWLLFSSCLFYSYFIPKYLLVLFAIIIIDFFAAQKIYHLQTDLKKAKWLLYLSICTNMGILFYFKYFNFVLENFALVFHEKFNALHIILPLGISFHTFQSIAYVAEVYKKRFNPEKNFFTYSTYVLFYPQLVAGPIERPGNLLPQLKRENKFNLENIIAGSRLMLWGFFKKVVIADRVGDYVDVVFKNPSGFNSSQVLVAVLLFCIQIYCDFSGYCDIAIGAAKCLGIDLTINFNRPFFSTSLRDFWKRWHISLSSWFRDYVYIPLGGNRLGKSTTYINIFTVFVLSGIWHGASWMFTIWGGVHGILLIGEKIIHKKIKTSLLYRLVSFISTFIIVSLMWIFFRASSMKVVSDVFSKIFSFRHYEDIRIRMYSGGQLVIYSHFQIALIGLFIIGMILLEKLMTPKMTSGNTLKYFDYIYFPAITAVILLLGVFNNATFIYFQF